MLEPHHVLGYAQAVKVLYDPNIIRFTVVYNVQQQWGLETVESFKHALPVCGVV